MRRALLHLKSESLKVWPERLTGHVCGVQQSKKLGVICHKYDVFNDFQIFNS